MNRLNKVLPMAVSVAFLFLLASGTVYAADGQALYTEKTCVVCHGTDGKTPMLPVYPKLAGQRAEYLLAQMVDIKSGARNNGQTAAMKGIMANVSEEEMKAIADWLSGL